VPPASVKPIARVVGQGAVTGASGTTAPPPNTALPTGDEKLHPPPEPFDAAPLPVLDALALVPGPPPLDVVDVAEPPAPLELPEADAETVLFTPSLEQPACAIAATTTKPTRPLAFRSRVLIALLSSGPPRESTGCMPNVDEGGTESTTTRGDGVQRRRGVNVADP